MTNIKYSRRPPLQYSDEMAVLYPEKMSTPGTKVKTITFQVTEACCLMCTYCYQHHVNDKRMSFETAKIFIDKLLTDQYPEVTAANTPAVVFEFIGGEPFLEIDLIIQIVDYLYDQMLKLQHPWLYFSELSISTNGILYFDPKVQYFLNKYASQLSLSISLDGNKKLHDACRIDLNGNGSYDRVIAAVRAYHAQFGKMPGIKMTFSPQNIMYLYDAMVSVIQEGYRDIYGNCVFEEGWTYSDATILYHQLVKIADYIIDNNLNKDLFMSFFEEQIGHPMSLENNENWCGGTSNSMLAIDANGKIFTCIRYMDSSLQGDQPELSIGTIEHGLNATDKEKNNYKMLTEITRTSQSTKECIDCPIAEGCAWCSGYNYQKTGTPNKRVTYICPMHKARVLANVYYWNTIFNKYRINKHFKNNLPDKEALRIISPEELEKLKKIEKGE